MGPPASPMLPSAGPLPQGPRWTFAVKWDGIRILAQVGREGIRLWTRSGREVTSQFPELRALGPALGRDAVLDGELVVLTPDGRPDFDGVRRRLVGGRPPGAPSASSQGAAQSHPGQLCLVLFDVLSLDGRSVAELPFDQRRRRLEALALVGSHWHTPPLYADGRALLDATGALGLEGVVAKRLDSPYRPGRATSWRKGKHRWRTELAVGGWVSRPDGGVAELLVGRPDESGLAYLGRVGLGLTRSDREELTPQLLALESGTSPFGFRMRGIRWTLPQLRVTVDHSMPTPNGRLREPRFVAACDRY